MSLRANIEHLSAAAGIEAVSIVGTDNQAEFRGDGHWKPILDSALSLLSKTGESTIRLVIGANTVVLQVEGDETVAVVLPTGHAIAKSLRRMIRRLSRKARGPVVRPALHHLSSASPATSAPRTSPASPPGSPLAESGDSKPLTPWG
jgi:hypothetical protein